MAQPPRPLSFSSITPDALPPAPARDLGRRRGLHKKAAGRQRPL